MTIVSFYPERLSRYMVHWQMLGYGFLQGHCVLSSGEVRVLDIGRSRRHWPWYRLVWRSSR